jgi:putative ABC transport system permease protein
MLHARKLADRIDLTKEAKTCIFNPDGLSGNHRHGAVIGVVGDARDNGPKSPPQPVVYTVFAQEPSGSAVVTLRTDRLDQHLIASILRVVKAINPGVPVYAVRTAEAQIDEALSRERLLATLGVLFGSLALLLVAIGLYGLLVGAVTRRANEIGIRMALGARPTNILWLVVRESLMLVFLGLLAGLGGGMLLTRFVRSQLFGVAPADPLTLASAAIVLLAVALTAICLPARHASRIDPIVALHYE